MDKKRIKMIRLAILEDVSRSISKYVLPGDEEENGVFCTLRHAQGTNGSRLLITSVLYPPDDAWEYKGPDMLRPSARWISAAISHAVREKAGLIFIHSHPKPGHPVGLSVPDLSSFQTLAKTIAPMLDGPFVAGVVHPNGWAGAVWANNTVLPIDRITSIGRTLEFLSPIVSKPQTDLDVRQNDALGAVHDLLRHLTVAVVGIGGTGSPLAEQLFRMGVHEIILLDHDLLDTPSNVRRVFGARVSDLGKNDPKVKVISQHLKRIGLDSRIRPIKADVRTESGFRQLLDADVVFSMTDTHGSRAMINELASAYLLPVIDIGVRVSAKRKTSLCGLIAELRVLTPTTPCLWCRKTINSDVIRQENLPYDEREKLQREGYLIGSVGEPAPSVAPLTVLGSALAGSSLLALLSEEGEVAPSAFWVDGFFGDARRVTPQEPISGCRCRQQLGLGDAAQIPFMPDRR